MAASVVEQALSRIQSLLVSATAAGTHVERGREDGVSPDEMPTINIRRSQMQTDPRGLRSMQIRLTVELDIWASGPDWETSSDALHMQAHALLYADAVLRSQLLGCTGTDSQGASGEHQAGRLTARYDLLLFAPAADLTTPPA